MKRKDRLIKSAAIVALFAGVLIAFLQGFHVYAASEQSIYPTQRMDGIVIGEDVTIIEDEQLPAAQVPSDGLPVWCWILAVGSVVAGCGVYGYISRKEKKNV